MEEVRKEPLLQQLLRFDVDPIDFFASLGALDLLQMLSRLSVHRIKQSFRQSQGCCFVAASPQVLAVGRLEPAQLLQGAASLLANLSH